MKTKTTQPAGITLLPYADRVKLVRSRLSDLRLHRDFKPLPKSIKVKAGRGNDPGVGCTKRCPPRSLLREPSRQAPRN